MNSFVNYVVESGISLGVLTLIYVLFLSKETFFARNRLFLLCSVLFSIVLPLLHLQLYRFVFNPVQTDITSYTNLLETVTVYGTGVSLSLVEALTTHQYILLIYLVGAVIFAVRFLLRVVQLTQKIRRGVVYLRQGIKFVYIDDLSGPFSFLNYLFVSKELEQSEGWEKMLAHETEHIRQGHTIDLIVLELVAVFQWFNPLYWLLKREIKENHEYMADQAVLRKGVPVSHYKRILVNSCLGKRPVMGNAFNTSLIKSRFRMMSKIKSPVAANFKYIIGGAVVVILLLMFACENQNTSLSRKVIIGESAIKEEQARKVLDQMPLFPGGEKALRIHIAKTVKYPVEAQEKGIQGKVFVNFVVEKDGKVGKANILRGVSSLLDAEALRVISAMPDWEPAKKDGCPVAVEFTIPILFVLE